MISRFPRLPVVLLAVLAGASAGCRKASVSEPPATTPPAVTTSPPATMPPPAPASPPVSSAAPPALKPPAPQPAARVRAGVWGGDHLGLTVAAATAHFEFDCASGDAPGPIVLDAEGRFSVTGTFTPESGGPVREGDVSVRRRAVYSGRVTAETMTVDVQLVDSNERVGSFSVAIGRAPRLRKCRD